ncbi:hypothetical protein [Thiomicrorhabdus sp.]|uniref:alpha/beta hydrolase family esterase n=1 Tax=Thiomicrorhabdus sp. TaxID=2039724 RepID=UPI0029C8D077|nr:hypothetical protein [Thiomicrorhabdus sp.]
MNRNSHTHLSRCFGLFFILFSVIFFYSAKVESADDLTHYQLKVDGIDRTYHVHYPPNFAQRVQASVPLFLFLHGGGKSSGEDIAWRIGLNEIADKNGFIAVYPDGVGSQWNDGRNSHLRKGEDISRIDDVHFFSVLLDHLQKMPQVNARKTFVAGASNGGMMTLRLGCELSGRFTAIAAIIANIPKKILGSCHPRPELPVLIMNGTKDPLVPWKGGEMKFLGSEGGKVTSTAENVAFWVANNHCALTPEHRKLQDKVSRDRSTVEVFDYDRCDGHSRVVLYQINNGGHHIPGIESPELRFLFGNKNMDIQAIPEIWAFFKRYL